MHDIKRIARHAQRRFLHSRDDVRFEWGRDAAGVEFQSIRFGTYDHAKRIVRVHPRLNDRRVPEWFVEFVVYHELVHAELGHNKHSREFRTREAKHPRARDALTWRATHIKRILSSTWSTPPSR